MVHGGECRAGEEGTDRDGVTEVTGLHQVRVDGLFNGPDFGLRGHVPHRIAQVTRHLDDPYHPVAAHEQRGAAELRGGIDLSPRRTVVGQDLGHGRLAAGFDQEGEPVPDDPAAGQGRRGHRVGARRLGCPCLGCPCLGCQCLGCQCFGGRCAGGHGGPPAAGGAVGRLRTVGERTGSLLHDEIPQRVPAAEACAHRRHQLAVSRAVDPGQEVLGGLPLTGEEPLGGIAERLAELVADVAGHVGYLVANPLVSREEALLVIVEHIHQEQDPQPGRVTGGGLERLLTKGCHRWPGLCQR